MDESKLTMQQRNKINYHLRNGEPLPPLDRSRSATRSSIRKTPKITISTRPSRLRSQSVILESGAYEREKFVRTEPLADREEAKAKLQEMMEYGREGVRKRIIEQQKGNRNKVKEESKRKTRYDELKEEIQERVEWLEEMEQLGQGKKYRDIIRQQIAAKINEMKKLKPE